MSTNPTIYYLSKDADASRFGLTPAERNTMLGMSNARSQWGASARVIVIHIQDGTSIGSLDWWVNGYINGQKVQASSTVLIQKDGSILKVLGEDRAPWTNGDVKSPTAQSKYLRSLGGYIGAWCLTIEFEGRPHQALTAAQLAAGIWQVRDWETRYKIPHDRDHVLPHSSINSVDRSQCPSPVIYDAVFNGVLKDAPIVAPITYARPTRPAPVKAGELIGLKRIVTAGSSGANRRTAAKADAPLTGAAIEPGGTFVAVAYVDGEDIDGEGRWWIGDSGSAVWSGGTVEKP